MVTSLGAKHGRRSESIRQLHKTRVVCPKCPPEAPAVVNWVWLRNHLLTVHGTGPRERSEIMAELRPWPQYGGPN